MYIWNCYFCIEDAHLLYENDKKKCSHLSDNMWKLSLFLGKRLVKPIFLRSQALLIKYVSHRYKYTVIERAQVSKPYGLAIERANVPRIDFQYGCISSNKMPLRCLFWYFASFVNSEKFKSINSCWHRFVLISPSDFNS